MTCIFAGVWGCIDDVGETAGDTTTSGTSGTSGASDSTGGPAGCGDGMVVAPEACDDGNPVDGDGCNSDCQISGSLVWCEAELGGDGGGANYFDAVAADSQGSAIAAGSVYSAELDAHVSIVAKYDADGRRAWTTILEEDSTARGLVVGADDTIIVKSSERLFHLASSGEVVASTPPQTIHFHRLARSAAGVIGFAGSGPGVHGYHAIVGVLDEGLSVRWSREVDDLMTKTLGNGLAVDLAGNWLLAGTVLVETIDHGDTGTQEITTGLVRKYGPDGALHWSQIVPSTDPEYGLDITAVGVSPEDEPIALGVLTNNALFDTRNMVLSTLSPEGQIRQQRTLPNADHAVVGTGLAVMPDGAQVVGGYALPLDDEPVYAFVARYDVSGARQWIFRSALIQDRSANFDAVSASPSGVLFAAGTQRLEDWKKHRALICKIRQ